MAPTIHSSRAATPAVLEGDDGFSLMEVLVAFMVLAAVALATTAGLLLATKTGRRNTERVVAANLAAQQVEYLRSLGALTVPVGETAWPAVTVKGAQYQLRSVAQWQSADAGTDRCSGAATGTNAYLKASVFVRLPGTGPAREVRSDTLLTPRGGTGPTGAVRVLMLKRDGTRHTTPRPVTLTSVAPLPTQTINLSTDSFGCVVFEGLADGKYQITVNETGYAAPTGSQLFTETVAVDRLQPPATLTLSYDVAGAASLSFVNDATVARPAAPTMVLAHPGVRPLGKIESATQLRNGLFPFPTAYQGWLGKCVDADPATYSGGTRTNLLVTPGATTAGTVAGGNATIDVYYYKSTNPGRGYYYQANAKVRATNALCGQELTFLAPPAGSTTVATTNSSGRLTMSVPYGTWEFRVAGCTLQAGRTWPKVTYTPGTPTGTPSGPFIVLEPSCTGS